MHSSLSFKGSRKYLHGTDLLPFVMHCLASVAQSRFALLEARIEKFTHCQVEFVCGEEPQNWGGVVVKGLASVDGREERFWLCETGIAVEGARPYEEHDVLASVSLSGGKVFTLHDGQYTRIEQIVAAMKDFCNHTYPLDVGRWVFTGMRSPLGVTDFGSIRSIAFHQGLAKRLVLFKGYDGGGHECAVIEFARKN